jgi:hypothetical protein
MVGFPARFQNASALKNLKKTYCRINGLQSQLFLKPLQSGHPYGEIPLPVRWRFFDVFLKRSLYHNIIYILIGKIGYPMARRNRKNYDKRYYFKHRKRILSIKRQPEAMARRRLYRKRPHVIKYEIEYNRKYRKREVFKKYRREYLKRPKVIKYIQKYQKLYRQRPGAKKRHTEYIRKWRKKRKVVG